jgi:hypothetical protein
MNKPRTANRNSYQGRFIPYPAVRAALLLLALSLCAFAGESPVPSADATKPDLADLTFSNFLSAGWNEPWTRRSRGDGTPNMSLLRVQTNFLAQLFRTDYSHQDNLSDASVRGIDSLAGTLEYALNRRLMLALIGNYRSIDSRTAEDADGAAAAAFARLQWLDTATSSLAMTLRVGLPSHDLGEKETTVSLAIAGWQDLAPLGLKRVGLYYHVQEETLAGPGKSGNRRNDLTYTISLAKTWTSPESLFGNATTFVEAYGKTDLDGNDPGHTLITVTPGIRATIAHRHILMAGVEFPVTEPRPYERILRLTYIYNF